MRGRGLFAHSKANKLAAETGGWLTLAAFAWIYSYEFSEQFSMFRWGAAIWPRSVAVFIAIIATARFVTGLPAALSDSAEGPPPDERGAASKARLVETAKVVATFAIPLLYVVSLPRMGYLATTPFFLIAMVYVFGIRRLFTLLVVPVVFYVVTVVVFYKLLFLPLPAGYWPVFYDFSNSIVEWIY